jgi:acyl-CoA synthetase (AMP-forming)/AMP-acid ligase II
MSEREQRPPIWSSDVERTSIEGVPYLVYPKRERSVLRFLDLATRWGAREHIVEGEVRLTLDDLRAAADRGAAFLAARGVRPGDRVLLHGWNSADWIVAFWATLRRGAVVVAGNAWWSEEELEHALTLTAPAAVLSDRPPHPRAAVPWHPLAGLAEGADPPPPPPAPDEEAEAIVVFTSGSTGFPKAAAFSHRAIVAGLHSLLQITRRLPHQIPDDHPREVTLQTTPFFHFGGVQALQRAVVLGGTLVLTVGRFDPEQVAALIERERVQRWSAVPTMVARLLALEGLEARDLTSVRSVTLGGAPVPPGLMDRLRAAFPAVRDRVGTGWGLTEAGGQLTAASGRDTLERPGTVGRALPFVELRIAAPDTHGAGEVLARSPMQMTGYVGTEPTQDIDAEGWLRTGDLGRIDGDGWLWLTGRSKDVIVRGGENVAAAHVERALAEHPAVVDAAVVGLPHEDLGEEVAAAVTVRDAVTAGELRAFAGQRLASFAVPTRWWVRRDPLPTNDVGKVAKRRLQDDWQDRTGEEIA